MNLEYADFYKFNEDTGVLTWNGENTTVKFSDIVVSAKFSEAIYSTEINDLTLEGPLFNFDWFNAGDVGVGVALGLTTSPYVWVPYALLSAGLNSIETESYFYTPEEYTANFPIVYEDIRLYYESGIDASSIKSVSQEIDDDLRMAINLNPYTNYDYGRYSGFEFEFGFHNSSDIPGLPFNGEYSWDYKIQWTVKNGFLGYEVDPDTGHTTDQITLDRDYNRVRWGDNITVSC